MHTTKLPATVNVIGGGLAGSEVAYQLGSRGISVRLFEMRPKVMTPAHQTGGLAELVCSNTFKSEAPANPSRLLKDEMRQLGSIVLQAAPFAQVPAGDALAVDRIAFSKKVEELILATNNVERISCQVDSLNELPNADFTVIATGPLTQGALAHEIQALSQSDDLYFYDAIAPVVSADSIDRTIAFSASRYGKGGEDYLNCPFTREEYDRFYDALIAGEKTAFHDFESAKYFQGCQPIEAIAETGRNSPRFGPMKPVGLEDPRTGKRPYACVQLRIDNLSRSAYNLVGFQTKLKFGAQKEVFRLIPGLQNAEFLRLGTMHRNTYICSPKLLNDDLAVKTQPNLYFAGQIVGVEGYVESAASGIMVAYSILAKLLPTKHQWTLPPKETAMGALCRYLLSSDISQFQPVNIHFGLFDTNDFTVDPKVRKTMGKAGFRTAVLQEAYQKFLAWKARL